MKKYIYLLLLLAFIGCDQIKHDQDEKGRPERDHEAALTITKESKNSIDTVYTYWPLDTSVYNFDTLINSTFISIKTWSLNDSGLILGPIKGFKDGKKVIEYYFDHTHHSNIIIKNDSINQSITITVDSFRNHLPESFIKVAQLHINYFKEVQNNKIIFKAVISKPETDYSFLIIYYIANDNKVKVIDVLD